MDDGGDYDGGGGGGDYDGGDDEYNEEEEEVMDEEEHEAGFELRDAAEGGGAIPVSQYCTTKYMTKYEKARILGTRALQIR